MIDIDSTMAHDEHIEIIDYMHNENKNGQEQRN